MAKVLGTKIRNTIDIHTMSPADQLVKKIFYLFGPVVSLIVRVSQHFHFLKSTFSVLGPDFCDGCGSIGGVL